MKLQAIAAFLLMAAVAAHAQKPEEDMLRDAQKLYQSGKLAAAERGFTEITRVHPDNLVALMYLGQTLFREQKFAAAVVPYESVRSLEKRGTKLTLAQHRILRDQLAMAYGIGGRSAEAKALLLESVRTDPGYPLNYYNLACLSADEDNKDAVLKNLSLAFQHKDQVLPYTFKQTKQSPITFISHRHSKCLISLVTGRDVPGYRATRISVVDNSQRKAALRRSGNKLVAWIEH